eukprot:gene6499-8081_t
MVAYHDFEGITVHADEAPRLLRSIGDRPAVILRNHGLLAWGATVPQTFAILWTLQRACEIQLATFSMGGASAAIPVPEAIAEKCTRDALQFNPHHGAGRDVFDALVRQRVAIVGAGAIGGWLGVLLSHTGCIVSALARGDTLAALQREGLQLHENGRLIGAPVEASSSAVALGVQDLVIVAVKAPALADVARSIAPLIGRHTIVLTAMNGVPWWFFNGFGGERAGTRLQSVDPT